MAANSPKKARTQRPNLKVLFTTAYARNAIVHGGRLDPGVELLTKPFTQAALGEKLRDILDARATPARVLVVEDEILIQLFATECLEEAGLKVDTAVSASEALSKLQLIPGGVDAVIVDMGLPDRKGEDLIREIRSIYPSLPVIIASGQANNHLRSLFPDPDSYLLYGQTVHRRTASRCPSEQRNSLSEKLIGLETWVRESWLAEALFRWQRTESPCSNYDRTKKRLTLG